MTAADPDTHREAGAPRAALALVAVATAAMLGLLLDRQLFDTNFYSLWEATNLRAGDHPYRDFYEWGVPLQAMLSEAAQWIVGDRMAGEFILLHWLFIIAGAVISFDLGYRLTRSVPITAFTALLALAVLPDTPTFHYPKLFVYPAAVWLAWRYIDRPGIVSAAALGLLTGVAFLFRHDHGVYIGAASVLASVLVRVTATSRPWRLTAHDTAAYTVVAALVLLPWLVMVQTGEGLVDYVRTRAHLYDMWAGEDAYQAILKRNPLGFTDGWVPPPAKPGVVVFRWENDLTPEDRVELEQRFGLRRVDGPDADDRWRYQVDDVYAPKLFGLKNWTDNTEGLDWARLEALSSWIPAREPSRIWQAQITIVIPLLLLIPALFSFARSLAAGTPPPTQTLRLLLAGALLALADAKLIREVSYAHLVAPLTAAMATHFLTVRGGRLVDWVRLGVAGVLVAATGLTAIACMEPQAIFHEDNRRRLPAAFREMLVSPPIDAWMPPGEATQVMAEHDRDAWVKGEVDAWPEILLRYVHDCTADGDRVLVTGQTPFHVGYLLQRPIAGGHLFWHHRWRTDPPHEAQLLALLQQQSVPFAISTHDPVLGDLASYPSVHRYFTDHYTPLPGSHDLLLVDARRKPSGTFGPYGLPCFK
jgi:hypothetical protein